MVGVIKCWMMPHFCHISDTYPTQQIIRKLTYNEYEAICSVYYDILSHKLNKNTCSRESILCITYYSIRIWISTDTFVIAHCLRSTGWSYHSTHGRIISTNLHKLCITLGLSVIETSIVNFKITTHNVITLQS